MTQPFPHLFQPIQIGNVTIRNRITSSAHGTCLSLGGIPTPDLAAYHQARARGGIGLIVIEGIRVHPTSAPHALAPAGWKEEIVEPLRRVVDAVRAEGAAIFAQILHQGRQIGTAYSQLPLMAPSPLPCPVNKEIPVEMTHADIREMVAAFANTAVRLKRAGFDGLEIHAAHGYLIQEFMSPFSNTRQDEYGGSLDNRLRFAMEVLTAVRAAVGEGYVLGLRLSADEFTEGGLGVEEMKPIARRFAETKMVNYFSISHSNYNGPSYSTMIPDMHYPRAAWVPLQAAIHAVAPNIPSISVGRIIDPAEAEDIIASGQADMVAMTRAQIADPELANKARAGRANEIRTCISCNQGCAGMVHSANPIRCVVNPAAGRELALSSLPARAEASKRVVIAGAGPAGLEAARQAALRGHQVTVLERSGVTGGQVRDAALAEQRHEIVQLVDQLERAVDRLGVDVRLNTEATAEAILALGPDAVVVATGASPRPHPLGFIDVAEALRNPAAVGSQVVVVDEDRHFKAAATAEFFAKQGKNVTLVMTAGDVGPEIPGVSLMALKYRLGGLGVTVVPSSTVSARDGATVTVKNLLTGRTEALGGVDTVVYAGPYQKVDGLASALAGQAAVVAVGDARAPRRLLEAMREGHDAGRTL